jgi:two-component system phosphate regulon sensor histidine kinase PhoR
VHVLNQRAERMLRCPMVSQRQVEPLAAICSAQELREVIGIARTRMAIQRIHWQRDDQDLEAFALPADSGWVALVLVSRRSLEAQLEQQERWVSDVAHELRTPLTALLLVGDSLAQQVEGRGAVLVERLQRELLRLQRLVNDLLELSRLENTLPEAESNRERVDLGALVERVWSGLRPLAQERGVGLEVTGDPHCPVAGDGSRLHRALLNLLDNALRFSPDGGTIRVSLRCRPDWCLLSVRDEGPGLSEEDQERLFERFYRGDPARARSRGGGSGLGLAIVHQIAMTHGGIVQAGNDPGGGARIELMLPAAPAPERS